MSCIFEFKVRIIRNLITGRFFGMSALKAVKWGIFIFVSIANFLMYRGCKSFLDFFHCFIFFGMSAFWPNVLEPVV